MSNLWRRNGRDPFRDKRFRALPRHRDRNRNRDRIRVLNHWFKLYFLRFLFSWNSGLNGYKHLTFLGFIDCIMDESLRA